MTTRPNRRHPGLAALTRPGPGRDSPLAPLDPRAAMAQADWDQTLGPLALAARPVAPPDDLFARISARIDDECVPATSSLRAETGGWTEIAPRIWRRTLSAEDGAGRRSFLLRCEPDSVIPEHAHVGAEEILVLEGSVRVMNLTLHAGDFHRAVPGSQHQPSRSTQGCLLLVHLLAA